MGILAADNNVRLMTGLLALGALTLLWFFRHVRARESAGKEPLLSTSLFRDRTSNLGLITQNIQWLLLMGSSFTVAAYRQVVRGYDAIATGVIFTAATLGLLATSLAAERLARRRPQRTLIIAGFVVTIAGVVVLIAMGNSFSSPWAFAPGLLLVGLGPGVMLTPSVNIVQSSFPEPAGRDLRPVPQRVQPRLRTGHGRGRHHPRSRIHHPFLRRGHGHARRARPPRPHRRGPPSGNRRQRPGHGGHRGTQRRLIPGLRRGTSAPQHVVPPPSGRSAGPSPM
ncbi:MFS transporter [Streptomyces sp. NPDC086182]|uniref:MFS transporter n=1 Tax=Streptomyces sp. NPDC086182 TaxID=3155058 RepID=UPI0034136289